MMTSKIQKRCVDVNVCDDILIEISKYFLFNETIKLFILNKWTYDKIICGGLRSIKYVNGSLIPYRYSESVNLMRIEHKMTNGQYFLISILYLDKFPMLTRIKLDLRNLCSQLGSFIDKTKIFKYVSICPTLQRVSIVSANTYLTQHDSAALMACNAMRELVLDDMNISNLAFRGFAFYGLQSLKFKNCTFNGILTNLHKLTIKELSFYRCDLNESNLYKLFEQMSDLEMIRIKKCEGVNIESVEQIAREYGDCIEYIM